MGSFSLLSTSDGVLTCNPKSIPINPLPSPPDSLDDPIDHHRDDDVASFYSRDDEGGGKKRKVPSLQPDLLTTPKIRTSQLKVGNETITIYPPAQTLNHSRIHRVNLLSRNRLLRRKAALITLYLDAQTIILTGTSNLETKPTFPDVPMFEKLLPVLECVGVGEWPLDEDGWRYGLETSSRVIKERDSWKTGLYKRKRECERRKPVKREGWAPEGSFEFESECLASILSRAMTRDKLALQKLILDLRTIVLSSTTPPPPLSDFLSDDGEPIKTKRRLEQKALNHKEENEQIDSRPVSTPEKVLNIDTKTPSESTNKSSPSVSSNGKESPETNTTPSSQPKTGKKKPKKKKRSVLANQSNPHHVDNYRSNRVFTPQNEPFESYASHANMLFPPPMRFLSARPRRKTAPLPGAPPIVPIRPAEDEYTCCFCDYALFFGSEKLRKWAIRERRREIKKKDVIKQKAKNVAEGKPMNDGQEDDYDDDDDCEDDEEHDERCTCGRAINKRRVRVRPPESDKDPPVDDSLD
ncbi:hypothetical protein M231_07689 [Tremella mesenterica]|uniref:Uncharacterized protein n=1 Tax=Tremella mesenterica TaxID=5217 RepID=A0A4Q1B8J3_TREME|nr:hypothetical protein M231_07689 [Tremella mesenterica]